MLSYILWGLALYLLSGYWVVYMSIREGESKRSTLFYWFFWFPALCALSIACIIMPNFVDYFLNTFGEDNDKAN